MMLQDKFSPHRWERGQSLVELALILPILIILLAGVVEVSHIAITKNRVESAARAAARFAANGGEDETLYVVALNTVTQTLDLDSGLWDIWVIRGQVNNGGNAFIDNSWTVSHIYGISNTKAFTRVVAQLDPECTTDCIRDRLLTQLQTDGQGIHQDPAVNPIARNLEIVSVIIAHDMDPILGLNALPGLDTINSVEGFSMMRLINLAPSNQTDGCQSVFPIVIEQGARSLGPGNFPPAAAIEYPTTNKPTYLRFPHNVPDRSLLDAQEGYVYQFSRSALRLAWAKWDPLSADGNGTLAGSLVWPGNSQFFKKPGDATDTSLHTGDRVGANLSATVSGVATSLQEHINRHRTLRVIVVAEGGGAPQFLPPPASTPYYTIAGFATIRLHAYNGSSQWLLAEFVGWDTSCGQVAAN